MASTETLTYQHQDNLASQYLSNSLTSLSQSRSTNSLIVRTYKQATQQYLTKRFKEALETLEPIITPQQQQGADGEEVNGDEGVSDGAAAPIAQSSRGTRTKVWVFYLSLLHAIVDLGQEQGKLIFGSTVWRQLAAKVRDGSVWEEIVKHGYAGNEGEVDPDVVVNLATLLLEHMQDQRLNQQRLETYLAASNGEATTNGNGSFAQQDGMSTPLSTHSSSSSPKALASRLKILELYALHVLPANGEWEYAQQVIEMSDGLLDEERKEAWLHALHGLQEEKEGSAKKEAELKEQREREMEEQRKGKQREAEEEEERRKTEEKQKAASKAAQGLNGTAAPTPAKATPSPKPSSSSQPVPSAARPGSKKSPPHSSPPPTFYRRASSLITNFQHTIMQASRNLTNSQSSMAVLRFVMFMLAFLLMITMRRDLRLKLQRATERGWMKIKQTVGMGVKVTYI